MSFNPAYMPLDASSINPDWVAQLHRHAESLEGKPAAEQEEFWDDLDRYVASIQQKLFGPGYTLGEQDLENFRAELSRVAQSSNIVSTPVGLVGTFDNLSTPLSSLSPFEDVPTLPSSFSAFEDVLTPLDSFGTFEDVPTPLDSFGAFESVPTPQLSFSAFESVSTPEAPLDAFNGVPTQMTSFNSSQTLVPLDSRPLSFYGLQPLPFVAAGHDFISPGTMAEYGDSGLRSPPDFSRKRRHSVHIVDLSSTPRKVANIHERPVKRPMKPVPCKRAQPIPSTRPAQRGEQARPRQHHVHTNGGIVSWAWSDERIIAYLLQLGSMSIKIRNEGLPNYALNGPYHPLFSVCTAATVNITVLGNLKITVEELLTFFPAHTSWRDFAHRLQRNGWTATPITRMIYYTRGLTDTGLLKRNTIHKQIEVSDKAIDGVVYNRKNPRPANQALVNVYTCGGWNNDSRGKTGGNHILLHDWYLLDCAKGVTIEPAGLGRGLFTEALIHARANNNNPHLSELNQYIRDHQLMTDLLMGPKDPNPDVAALRRMDTTLFNYAKSIGLKK
jgi:hypothetical protein